MPVRFFQCICLLLLANPARSAPNASEQMAAAMTGTFSTTEQARGDQNFRNLTMHATPIWTDRMDGPWLYVEQALSDAPEHPHRQHIYQLIALTDGSLDLHVFDLPEPIAVTGAWKNPSRLGSLVPVDLSTHQVCTMVFQIQSDGSFNLYSAVQQTNLTTDSTDLHGYSNNSGRKPGSNPFTSWVKAREFVFD